MSDQLLESCAKAVQHLQTIDVPTRIRVVSHYDADGITAAAIICQTLYRKGYGFHASLMRNPFDKGFQRLQQEENTFIIFSDMGSGQLDFIEQLGCPCIILDHHQVKRESKSKQIVQVNANTCGYDGNYEACGATLAYGFAKTLDASNSDLAGLALIGATGDKQYIGGLRGWNQVVLDEALEHNIISSQIGVKLAGKTLGEALFFSIDPYYKGLSGDEQAIQDLFKHLNIDREQPPEKLSEEQRQHLQSLLLLQLLQNHVPKNIIDIVSRTRYIDKKLGVELERFADLLDACGKYNHRGVGLALCMGDAKASKEALRVEQEYKTQILDALQTLEKEGATEKTAYRLFYSDHSSLGGVIGGIAVNYLFDEQKPLVSLARKNGELHVSSRGNQKLVKNGLDLGDAMHEAAEKLDGYGGGHKIAAGATIDVEHEQAFLDDIDGILCKQLGLKP
jgi:RecJ-like exonuclease